MAESQAFEFPESVTRAATNTARCKRAWAFGTVCLGVLLVAMNITAVVVILQPIKAAVGFSEAALTWVINSYLIPCGGLLLLSGRLADVFGHRRFFLAGIALFAITSLGCAVAASELLFLVFRVVQGMSGAIVTTSAFALTMDMYGGAHERAKVLGIYGAAWAGGSVLGLLVGGILTSVWGWRSLFFSDAFVATALSALGAVLLPRFPVRERSQTLDVAGAIALTGALMLAVHVVLNGNASGWVSINSVISCGGLCLLGLVFRAIESRAVDPILPRDILRNPGLRVCGALNALTYLSWSAMVFCSLHLQVVLHFSPMAAGFALLPYEVVVTFMSLGVFAKLMMGFGIKSPLIVGLVTGAIAFAILGLAPTSGGYLTAILPGLLVMSAAAGLVFNTLSLAAVRNVSAADSGLVSGIMETTSVIGYALGLAALASIADSRTNQVRALGFTHEMAFSDGYHIAYRVSAGCLSMAALFAALFYSEPARVLEAGRVTSGNGNFKPR